MNWKVYDLDLNKAFTCVFKKHRWIKKKKAQAEGWAAKGKQEFGGDGNILNTDCGG